MPSSGFNTYHHYAQVIHMGFATLFDGINMCWTGNFSSCCPSYMMSNLDSTNLAHHELGSRVYYCYYFKTRAKANVAFQYVCESRLSIDIFLAGVCANISWIWPLREAVFGIFSGALAGLPAGLRARGGAAACGCGGKLHWRLHLSLLGS